MPLTHIPGEAQIDFGEADYFERNVRVGGHYLNVSFPHSNGGYTQLFKGENFQCLAEGLKNVFTHIGGVPQKLWLDNMSTAVKSILKGKERGLTDKFLRMKNHYGFQVTFCNPGKGHEKGNVESKVGYHRRNYFVPVPHFDDLKEYNKELLLMGDDDMERVHYRKRRLIKDLFQEDRQALLPLPAVSFDGSEVIPVKTDGYAKFTLDTGRHTYSTAPRYAKSRIHARLTAYEVIVLDENYREIAKHPRLYGESYQESMDWLPYLGQLSKRPSALKYTGIYHLLPLEIREFLDTCSYQSKRETLKVLAELTVKSSFEMALEAVKDVVVHGVRDADSVVAAFNRLNSDAMIIDSIVLSKDVPSIPTFKPSLRQYDRIFLGEGTRHES
jgi:hypothetical protein